jgi:integrase
VLGLTQDLEGTVVSSRRISPRLYRLRPLQVAERLSTNPKWATAYAAALIAASTTSRGADLRSLRWSDVDLFEGVVTIPDSKSDAGKRRIPLNPDAMLGFRLLS